MTFQGDSSADAQPDRKIVVVTGGCGIIGSVLVRELCALPEHTVVILDRATSQVTRLASSLSLGQGSSAIGVEVDLANIDSLAAVADHITTDIGVPTGLVNAAVSKGSDLAAFLDTVESYSPDTWREVMNVNVDGLFFLTRTIGAAMAAKRRGSIVNFSSIYGHLGPDQRIYDGSEYEGLPISSPAVYSASKAAILGLTKHLATWWGHTGVRVNAVSPGGVFSGQNDQFVESYSARVPLARMAEATEITSVVRFLLSPESSYMTGQNLCVDGGLSAW